MFSSCRCDTFVHDHVLKDELLMSQVMDEQKLALTDSPLAKTKCESLSDLDEETKIEVDRLLMNNYIFEACAICPDYVEARGHLKTFRDLAQCLCGDVQAKWERTYDGTIRGCKYHFQQRYGGATVYDDGEDFLWFMIALDQEIGWGKMFGSWHETEWSVQKYREVKECYMIGDDHPTHGIRCEIRKEFGQTSQEYLEVRRYFNKETGFCIESNASVSRADLINRGYTLGEAKHEPRGETLVHILSFPRSDTQSTAVFLMRYKPNNLPKWLLRFATTLAPTLAKMMLPGIESNWNDPSLQALMDADKRGVHGYFKDWTQKALAAGVGKYNALNLPPAEVVIGRWTNPADSNPSAQQKDHSGPVMSNVTRRRSKVSDVSAGTCWSRQMHRLLARVCNPLGK